MLVPTINPRFALIALGSAAVVLVVMAPSYYFYSKYQHSQQLLKNPAQAQAEDMRALVASVGKVIELPSEEPTLATVTDNEKLSSQPFFAKSQNGDKVLIYAQSKKAILYRPSIGKVIEVSTLNISDAEVSSPSAVTSPGAVIKSMTVMLFNGTPTVGMTAGAEKKLKADPVLSPIIAAIEKENAVKKDYTKTIVVVLTPVFAPEAEKIATLLGGTVSALPEGEVRPAADIAVIIGK